MIKIYILSFFLIICILIFLSLWIRVRNYRRNFKNQACLADVEVKQTAFSKAVQNLVATAGGVYLTLVMITSFLKINLPAVINLADFTRFNSFLLETQFEELTVDPLALFSFLLAIVEPIFSQIWRIIIKSR